MTGVMPVAGRRAASLAIAMAVPLRNPYGVRSSAVSAQGDPDRLGLGVLSEGLHAIVAAAEPGLAVTAEGGRDVALAVAVDSDRPCPDGTRSSQGEVDVAGPYGGGQAVGG